MKATELRLGNFVKWVERIESVKQLFEDGVGIAYEQDSDYWTQMIEADDLEGIPLTPEIFVLNGFGEDNNGHFLLDLQTHYLEIIPMKDGFYPMYGQKRETSGDNDNMVSLNRIDYVHQLQNLYFALTGEELNINLC